MTFNDYIPKLELKAGNVGGPGLVFGLCEGAGNLKDVLGVDVDGIPSLKGLSGRFPQGGLGALKK